MKHLHQLYFTSLLVLPSPRFSAISSSIFKSMFSSPEMEKTDIPPLVPSALSPLFFSKQSQQNWGRTSALVRKQHKAGRSQPSAHRWMSQHHMKSRTILQLPAMRCSFNSGIVSATLKHAYSHPSYRKATYVKLEVNLPFLSTAFINGSCYIGPPRRSNQQGRGFLTISLLPKISHLAKKKKN